jgi:hypothetical protein
LKTRVPSATMLVFAAIVSSLLVGQSAQAGYVLTLEQVGPNLVATGTGALDLSGLHSAAMDFGRSESKLAPDSAFISTGPTGLVFFEDYIGLGAITGPTNFGSGAAVLAISGSGDFVGIIAVEQLLFVPQGYISDEPLSSSATFPGSFDSDGVTPGTYEWTWGPGPDQNFTLLVVPEPTSLSLLVFGVLLLLLLTGFRYRQSA